MIRQRRFQIFERCHTSNGFISLRCSPPSAEGTTPQKTDNHFYQHLLLGQSPHQRIINFLRFFFIQGRFFLSYQTEAQFNKTHFSLPRQQPHSLLQYYPMYQTFPGGRRCTLLVEQVTKSCLFKTGQGQGWLQTAESFILLHYRPCQFINITR